MRVEYVRGNRWITEHVKSPTESGLDQERLIKNIILDVASTQLGRGDTTADIPDQKIRERMTWNADSRIWTVNWFRPNTHPNAVGEIHVPDFDFWVDDRRLANLESKNWQPKWALTLNQTKEKIVSRVESRPVELGNILVISELLCQKSDERQILDLLQQCQFKVLLTHRKTGSSHDEAMYRIIRSQLEPILVYIFSFRGPKPDWTLFLIARKWVSPSILVLSMTPTTIRYTIPLPRHTPVPR